MAAVAVVLLGGSRAGWISATVVALCFLALAWRRAGRFPWKPVAGAAVVVALVGGTLWHSSPVFQYRLSLTPLELARWGKEPSSVEHRVWIWRAGWNMFRAHPLNGVGARGYRYAYPEHVEPGDPYFDTEPPYHSHQLIVEVLAETGLIGVAAMVAMLALLIRGYARAPPEARAAALPFGVCLVVVYWPLNTHMATYSAHWSQVLWWLLALYCAALGAGAATRR